MIPLDAVSLAANIIQFINFVVSLVSKADEIRKNGGLTEYVDLSTVNKDLISVTEKLKLGLPSGVLTDDEQGIFSICTGCLEVSRQLQSALEELGVDADAGKWKSIRKAFKAIWGKKKLLELNTRLEDFSVQLDRRVLVSLRY